MLTRRQFLAGAALGAVAAGCDPVSLGRRLLTASGGSGGLPGPTRALRTLTSSPQGGWTQVQDPKATYYNGATYFVSSPDTGTTSDIVVAKYVHATEVTTTKVLAAAYENPADNHSSPAVILRASDHRVVVVSMRHAEVTSPTVYISPNAEDISGTWTEVNPGAGIGAAQYTYPVLYELASGTIYLFYRDYISGTTTGRLGFTTSTDGGTTWSGRRILYTGATGKVPYWRVIASGGTRIDVFVTDDVPSVSSLGHFYYREDTDKVYSSAGAELTWNGASDPLVYADITQVHAANAWSWGGSIDSSGAPATVMMVDVGGTDNAIKTARWRSGAWQVNTVVASVGGQVTGNQYASGCAIHHGNPDIVYVARKATKWEMWRYVSGDDGVTWSGTQLTSGSSVDNIWSEVVHNAGSGLEGIWLAGTYTSDTDYAFGIKGWG